MSNAQNSKRSEFDEESILPGWFYWVFWLCNHRITKISPYWSVSVCTWLFVPNTPMYTTCVQDYARMFTLKAWHMWLITYRIWYHSTTHIQHAGYSKDFDSYLDPKLETVSIHIYIPGCRLSHGFNKTHPSRWISRRRGWDYWYIQNSRRIYCGYEILEQEIDSRWSCSHHLLFLKISTKPWMMRHRFLW